MSNHQQSVISAVLEARSSEPGALLPILHDIQDQLGYVPAGAVSQIAAALNLSRAEVHGVISYYHHFRSEKSAGPVVQVCRAEACQACGSDALWEHAQKKTQGAQVTLEPVYCLGLCASAPALFISSPSMGVDKPYARVTPSKFDRLLEQLKEAA